MDELDLHQPAQNILNALAESKNIPHLLFVGQAGCGRHTRALCMLKKIFNTQSINSISSTVTYTHGQSESELSVISSPIHLEINPSVVGTQDAAVITSVIKEAASARSINSAFKVIFIQQADKLSLLAQQALRRLMEEHAKTCKLFLFAESASGLMAPIRSRCFMLRLPTVKPAEMLQVFGGLQGKLKLQLKQQDLEELAAMAGGNLRRFLMLCQCFAVMKEAGKSEVLPKWEILFGELYQKYFTQHSSVDADLRKGIVEILKLGVPADVVIREFVRRILKESFRCPFMFFVLEQACEYDTRLKGAQVGLIHVEAFINMILHAKSVYK